MPAGTGRQKFFNPDVWIFVPDQTQICFYTGELP